MKPLERLLRAHPKDAVRVLYAASLALGEEGPTRIELRRGERALASVAFVVTGSPVQPWFALRAAEAEPLTELRQKDAPERFQNTCERGTPRWAGEVALMWELPRELIPLHRSLPLAAPRIPALKVRAKGSVLELELPGGLGNLEGKLLARWWVNGRPVQGPRTLQKIASAREGLMRELTRRRSIRIDVDRSILGAGPRDRIAVQLAYCPQGWDREPQERERRAVIAHRAHPAISARVSLDP